MRTNRNTKSILWMIPLFVVFFCFGLLLMAQYHTHQNENDALVNESSANLAMIIKSANDNQGEFGSRISHNCSSNWRKANPW